LLVALAAMVLVAGGVREYGQYLYQVGSSQEGMEHFRRAVEVDPLSPGSQGSLSFGYYFDRRFDQARDALRTVIDLDPGFNPNFYLGLIYREEGMFEEAITESRKAPEANSPISNLAHLGNAYARAEKVTEARGCLRKPFARRR
jgi:tetratricopeptide (TPR) repeat protein